MSEIESAVVQFSSESYFEAVALRNRILRQPLGLNLFEEDLSDEINQFHFVANEGQKVIGVVVMVVTGGTAKLRQMAVEPFQQGKGIGRLLVQKLEEKAKSLKLNQVKLHARYHAVVFYEKLGYHKTDKPSFEEVGIEHFEMVKKIE